MIRLFALVFGGIFLGLISAGAKGDERTMEQLLREQSKVSIDRSIELVAPPLMKKEVFVGTVSGAESGRLRLLTGLDNEGHPWIYAYTSIAELSMALPKGASYVEMPFSDLFGIAEANTTFRGIYLNSGSDAFYPIPREVFGYLRRALPAH